MQSANDVMSSHRRHVVLELAAWLTLLLVLSLAWFRAAPLREAISKAIATSEKVQSDDDLHGLPRLCGRDYQLVQRIRSDYPPGTPVSIPWDNRMGHRIMKGFWLGLLPDNPIRENATLHLISRKHQKPDDRVIAGGPLFVLVERHQP